MTRTIELNSASAVFANEAYGVLSCDELTLDGLLSLAASLAGKASQFEYLSVQEKHELILNSVVKACQRLSSAGLVEKERVQKMETYIQETLPILLNGFVFASKQKKANSFWNRVGCEVVDAWRQITSSLSAKKYVETPAKEVSQTPTTLEKKVEVAVQEPQQQQQEEKPLPSSQTATTNT
jgi:hypothetical protein